MALNFLGVQNNLFGESQLLKQGIGAQELNEINIDTNTSNVEQIKSDTNYSTLISKSHISQTGKVMVQGISVMLAQIDWANVTIKLDTGSPSLSNGLVSYWKLDESVGSVIDSHDSNNGSASNATLGVAGKILTSYGFNGANSVVTIPTNVGLQPTSLTLNAWLKTHDDNGYAIQHRAEDIDQGRSSYGFNIVGSLLNGISYKSANDSGAAVSGIILQDTWVMATLVANEVGNTLYLNGSLVDSSTTTGSIRYSTVDTTTYFGARHRTGTTKDLYYSGLIDEVGFWNKSLTPTEITQLYNIGSGTPYGNFSTSSYIPGTEMINLWLEGDGGRIITTIGFAEVAIGKPITYNFKWKMGELEDPVVAGGTFGNYSIIIQDIKV